MTEPAKLPTCEGGEGRLREADEDGDKLGPPDFEPRPPMMRARQQSWPRRQQSPGRNIKVLRCSDGTEVVVEMRQMADGKWQMADGRWQMALWWAAEGPD